MTRTMMVADRYRLGRLRPGEAGAETYDAWDGHLNRPVIITLLDAASHPLAGPEGIEPDRVVDGGWQEGRPFRVQQPTDVPSTPVSGPRVDPDASTRLETGLDPGRAGRARLRPPLLLATAASCAVVVLVALAAGFSHTPPPEIAEGRTRASALPEERTPVAHVRTSARTPVRRAPVVPSTRQEPARTVTVVRADTVDPSGGARPSVPGRAWPNRPVTGGGDRFGRAEKLQKDREKAAEKEEKERAKKAETDEKEREKEEREREREREKGEKEREREDEKRGDGGHGGDD